MAAISSALTSSLSQYPLHRREESSSSLRAVLSPPSLSPSGRCPLSLSQIRRKKLRWDFTAVAEEETLTPEDPVSVVVSPSDMLTMFFKAEGTLAEAAVSKVSEALDKIEGVSDTRVHVSEGIASVELTKQTTVQATGVASSLVEIIQGSGFKLQTLNLSFEDEEDAIN